MRPKGAEVMANIVDPDQEQSDLAQTCRSKHLGLLHAYR